MNKFLLAVATAATIFIVPAAVRAESGQCRELRLACENKDRLGEQGAGNCRTYREACQRREPRMSCERLRYLCLHKEEYGLEGGGYCRTYREHCR